MLEPMRKNNIYSEYGINLRYARIEFIFICSKFVPNLLYYDLNRQWNETSHPEAEVRNSVRTERLRDQSNLKFMLVRA